MSPQLRCRLVSCQALWGTSGCDSLPSLSVINDPTLTNPLIFIQKYWHLVWFFFFFWSRLEAEAAAVPGRGGRRAGRTGGEEAQPPPCALRVPQRPAGFPPLPSTRPGPLRGLPSGGRQQAGRSPPVSRQGAAPPEAVLGGPLPAAPRAAPRREAQGCG